MKYIFAIFIAIFLCFAGEMQAKEIKESEIPAEVKLSVKQNYPEVRWIEWDYNKKRKNYKASFFVDGREHHLTISAEGFFLYSKIDIYTEEVPKFAVDYIREHYKGAEVIGGYRYVSKSNNTYYRVDAVLFRKGGKIQRHKAYFNEVGEIIKISESK